MKTLVQLCLVLSLHLLSVNLFAANLEPGKRISVVVDSEMEDFLHTLSESEQMEQLRDWIVLSYFKQIGTDEASFFEAFFDYTPLRSEFKLKLVDFNYGERRAIALRDGSLHVFVPASEAMQKVHIARACDEYRMLHLKMPAEVFKVEYELEGKPGELASFTLEGSVAVKDIFSPTYGYYTQNVSSKADLARLLKRVDDITYLQKMANGAVQFGGRKFTNYNTRSVTIEDLGALYQADLNAAEELEKRIGARGLKAEYDSHVQRNVDYNLELNPSLRLKPRFVVEAEFRRFFPYESYYDERLAEFKKNINIGFSLDHKLRNQAFSRDLLRIIEGDEAFFKSWFDRFLKKQVTNRYLLSKAENKKESDQYSKSHDLWSNVTKIMTEEKETSVQSLIFGPESDSQENDSNSGGYDKLNDALKKASDVTDEEIEEYLAREVEAMYQAIIVHKPMLQEIAKKVAAGEELPLSQYRAFLNNNLTFELTAGADEYVEYNLKEPADQTFLRLKEEIGYSFIWIEGLIKVRKDVSPVEVLYEQSKKLGIDTDKYFEKTEYAKNKYLEQFIIPDLVRLLKLNGYEVSEEKTTFDEELSRVVATFQKKSQLEPTGKLDQLTFRVLSNQFRSYTVKGEMELLSSFLFDWDQDNSFQYARYDGKLQGTEVGMNLFYTDLVMKLWGFDYQNTAPGKFVPGFLSKADRKINFTYYENFSKYSSTRSWLNELESAYEGTTNEMWFANCATRIFNASSSDLAPGVEVEADRKSYMFANWWNENYIVVADYEQEYHRLNQIMKWTAIINWLKIDGKFQFLANVSVRRDLDFAEWYANNREDLKVQIPIPFIDHKALGEKTECLNMIPSKPFFAFENERYIYRYSGGVSLPTPTRLRSRIEAPKKMNLRNSGIPKKGVDLANTTNTNELKYFNEKKIKLDIQRKTATTNSEKVEVLNGKNAELHHPEVSYTIDVNADNISLSETSGNNLYSRVNISGGADQVRLSMQKGEIMEAMDVFETVRKTNSRSDLFGISDNVDIYQMQSGEYYVSLKSSNKILKLKEGDGTATNMDLRLAKNQDLLTQQVKYYDGQFVEHTNFTNDIANYKWYKLSSTYFSNNTRKVFTNVEPTSFGTKINVSKGDQVIEASVERRSISFKTEGNLEQKLPLIKSVEQSLEGNSFNTLVADLAAENNMVKLVKTKEGDVIKIARQGTNTSKSDIDLFHSVLGENSTIKNVLIKENSEVKLISENTLQIPRELTPDQRNVVKFIDQKVAANKSWVEKLQKAGEIKPEDLTQLSKIQDGNIHLVDTYFNAREVRSLPDKYAVVDVNTVKDHPQMLVMSEAGKPEIRSIEVKLYKDVFEISRQLENYNRDNTTLTNIEFKELTKDLSNLYKAAMDASGKREIILAHTPNVNHSLIAKIHNIKGRVLNDQSDLERSIANADKHIYPDINVSVFVSTASLTQYAYNNIASTTENIYNLGIPKNDTLSYVAFLDILGNPDLKQIYLVIRANEDGLVFRDRTLFYEDLPRDLSLSTDKEMIYILSNEADKLQPVFANSGRFNSVITSGFSVGNPSTLTLALQNLYGFMESFEQSVVLSKGKLNKFKKKFPELSFSLDKWTSAEGKSFRFDIGRLGGVEKRSFSKDALSFISKYMSGFSKKQPMKFKSIEEAVDEIQLKNIQKMNVEAKPDFLQFDLIKSVPSYKVELDTPLNKAG